MYFIWAFLVTPHCERSLRWVAKLVARMLAPAALWVQSQTSLKNTKMGDIKLRRGNHTLARKKMYLYPE
jgi:hypothetical protein